MPTEIQLRRGTGAQWTATNPTLAPGEPGVETDTGKLKLGDGVTAWTSLAYATKGDTGLQGIPGTPVINWRNSPTFLIQASTVYALNDGVLSSNGGSYRCTTPFTTTGSPTDPSADATHWAPVVLPGPAGNAGGSGTTGSAGAGAELLAPTELTTTVTGLAVPASGLTGLITGMQLTIPSAPAKFRLHAKVSWVALTAGTVPNTLFVVLSDGTTRLDVCPFRVTALNDPITAWAEVRLPNSNFAIVAGNSYTFGVYLTANSAVTASVTAGTDGRPRLAAYGV